jgi:hypothetical protein
MSGNDNECSQRVKLADLYCLAKLSQLYKVAPLFLNWRLARQLGPWHCHVILLWLTSRRVCTSNRPEVLGVTYFHLEPH